LYERHGPTSLLIPVDPAAFHMIVTCTRGSVKMQEPPTPRNSLYSTLGHGRTVRRPCLLTPGVLAKLQKRLREAAGSGFTPTTTRIVAEFVDDAPPSCLGDYDATAWSVGVPLGTCQAIVQFDTVRRAPNRNVDLGLEGARQAATGSLVGQNLYYSTTCISGLALTSRSLHPGGKSGYVVTLSERSCPDAEPQRVPGRRGCR
jgi:hypothetical protein